MDGRCVGGVRNFLVRFLWACWRVVEQGIGEGIVGRHRIHRAVFSASRRIEQF